MSKFRYITLAGLIAILALPSCKKGENDPGLPFKTRKSRITGTWDFSTYILGTKTTFTAISTNINRLEEIDQDDIIVNTTTTDPSQSINLKEDGIVDRFVIDIKESGEFLLIKEYSLQSTYSVPIVSNDPADSLVEVVKTIQTSKDIIERSEGTWNWLGRVEDEFKNKERIALNYTEITVTQQNTVDTIIQTTVTDLGDDLLDPTDDTKEVDVYTARTTVTSGVTDRYSNGERTIVWPISRLAVDQVIVEREIDQFASTNIKTVLNTDTNGVALPLSSGIVIEDEGAQTTIGTETFILTPTGVPLLEEE